LSRSLIGYNGLDNCKAIPYNANVIRSFRSKGLRRFAERGDASRLSVQNPDRVRRIVLALNAAKSPEGMNSPGFRFHALKGKDRGRYAIDASGNWRVTFAWDGEDAVDVDLEDYH
jgi:proteic killer suppression protein